MKRAAKHSALFFCLFLFILTPFTRAFSEPKALLSETGLYADIRQKIVTDTHIAFKPNFELWSDGAGKARWLFLPPGGKINSSDMNSWTFPVGTKLWKEFSFRGRRVETRHIEKIAEANTLASWQFSTYIWRADESEADLAPAAGLRDAAPTGFLANGELAIPIEAGTSHDIPARFACTRCHNKGGDAVLGFNAIQLTGLLADDSAGAPMGQLKTLIDKDLLTHTPLAPPDIPSPDRRVRQALGHLNANCANCHNPNSSAGRSTGMHLNLLANAASLAEEPAYVTAVNQLTTGFEVPGRQLGLDAFRIQSGMPDVSAIYYRMHSREPFEQMPPLGTEVVNTSVLAILAEWINSL